MEHLEIQKVPFPAFPARTVARARHGGVVRPGRHWGYPHVNHHHSLNQGGENNQNKTKITFAGSTTRTKSWQRCQGVTPIFFPPFFCSPSEQRQAAPGGECPNFGTVVRGRPARPGAAPARAPAPPAPSASPGGPCPALTRSGGSAARTGEGGARGSGGSAKRGAAGEARRRRGGHAGEDLNRGEVNVKPAAGAAVPGSIPCRRGSPGRRPSWGA